MTRYEKSRDGSVTIEVADSAGYCWGVERAIDLSRAGQIVVHADIPRMTDIVECMVKDAIDSFVDGDSTKAWSVLERDDEVDELYHHGLEEHCASMPSGPTADNCLAWYDALAGRHLDAALERITRSLESEGERSDFLDTAAMVHLARGEVDEALVMARRAARMSPDDVYMLWQAERIGDMLRTAQ